MTNFFTVSHNSSYTRGFPWAERVVSGLTRGPACAVCGVEPFLAEGDIEVALERKKGSTWPDALGCGAYPFFIVSDRALAAWRAEGVGDFPRHAVRVVGPVPAKLSAQPPPAYSWIDGGRLLGARLDFEAGGFVGVRFCPGCGNRTHEVAATYNRRRSGRWPFAFVPGTWNGGPLFTTDLSPTQFFCTSEILRCARDYRLTNFRFLPTEDGGDAESKGLQYLPAGHH